MRDFVERLTRGFIRVQWDRDIIGCNQGHEVPAIPRGRSVDHAVIVVLGKAGTNGADISADVLALLRAVSRQLDDLPCVFETGQRRRFFVRVEVKNRLNRADLLELGFQHPGTVALLVQVQDHDTLALLGQMPRDMTGKRGLADAAALIGHYDCSH